MPALRVSLPPRPSSRSSDHRGVFASCPIVKHADLGQTRLSHQAHSPHQLDGQVLKEFQFGVGIDNHQPIGLGQLRGDFRQMLGARHAD